MIISAGFSTIISLACAIVGIVYSRKGKKKVDAGETPKHRGLAQAGFIIGWISLGLSILATIAWAARDRDRDRPTTTSTATTTRTPSRLTAAVAPRRRAVHRGLTLFSPVRAESLRQAVPDDRRPDAAAARRVAGDGRADGLPPRARIRGGLRARAEAPQGPLPDPERGAGLHRLRKRGARVRSREPRAARRADPRGVVRQVRRALVRALRGLRRRDDPLGDASGAARSIRPSSTACWARTRRSSWSSPPSPRRPPAW